MVWASLDRSAVLPLACWEWLMVPRRYTSHHFKLARGGGWCDNLGLVQLCCRHCCEAQRRDHVDEKIPAMIVFGAAKPTVDVGWHIPTCLAASSLHGLSLPFACILCLTTPGKERVSSLDDCAICQQGVGGLQYACSADSARTGCHSWRGWLANDGPRRRLEPKFDLQQHTYRGRRKRGPKFRVRYNTCKRRMVQDP